MQEELLGVVLLQRAEFVFKISSKLFDLLWTFAHCILGELSNEFVHHVMKRLFFVVIGLLVEVVFLGEVEVEAGDGEEGLHDGDEVAEVEGVDDAAWGELELLSV